MKILHIIPSYLPAVHASGPIKAVHYVNKWLTKNGADVTVFTINIDGRRILDVPLEREIIKEGVKILYVILIHLELRNEYLGRQTCPFIG